MLNRNSILVIYSNSTFPKWDNACQIETHRLTISEVFNSWSLVEQRTGLSDL